MPDAPPGPAPVLGRLVSVGPPVADWLGLVEARADGFTLAAPDAVGLVTAEALADAEWLAEALVDG